jgi:hypothetical protein
MPPKKKGKRKKPKRKNYKQVALAPPSPIL